MDTETIFVTEQRLAWRQEESRVKTYHPVSTPRTLYITYFKRLGDVVLSLVLIASVLSWMIPLLFILIRFTSSGPLFFVQERVGRNGRRFACFKFRTMRVNRQSETIQAGSDDVRITRIGMLLRRTHIDELPQLFNVLLNDMSIVGPRPHMLYHDMLFSAMLPEYQQRHLLKPGITGLAQAQGYHGATPDYNSISNRTRLDLFYVRKASLMLDARILFLTLFVAPLKYFRRYGRGKQA